MPIMTSSMDERGRCLINVVIGFPDLARSERERAGQAIPAEVVATAMIDTGCSHTVVARRVMARTGLVPSSCRLLATVAGTISLVAVPTYRAKLCLSHEDRRMALCQDLEISETPDGIEDHDVLLGMDVLANCFFAFNGPEGYFTLAY